MDQQITLDFMLGYSRASEDPEVKEALAVIDDMALLVRHFGDVRGEDEAHRRIAEFALREARRLEAREMDLSLVEFTHRERELLQNHPAGRRLVVRMTDGDESAVVPAASLLTEIKRVRSDHGLT